jgi:hypothetical protein
MSFRNDQYVDLLNALLFSGMASFGAEFDMNDDRNEMRKLLSDELTRLNYNGNRKNYQEIVNWVNNLQPFPPPNIESDEENIIEESPNIESNLPINQNFIPNENMAQQGGICNLNTYPAMDALINLVGKQGKEIKKMEKLITQ